MVLVDRNGDNSIFSSFEISLVATTKPSRQGCIIMSYRLFSLYSVQTKHSCLLRCCTIDAN